MKNISFQGEHGAFSEQAAINYFGLKNNFIECENFRDVFDSVLKSKTNFGIIPIENSLFGSIHQNFDLLFEYNLKIIGEIKLRVRMNLMALPKTKLLDLKNVYSHPQAIGQSDKFLRTLKNVKVHPFYDTAGAAKYISSEKKIDSAAIASVAAAKYYKLNILKKGIESDKNNFTRFVVISKIGKIEKQDSKTSLIFSLKHTPGSLQNCLNIFASRNLNLLKIESRPYVGKPWEYLFFVDVANDKNFSKIADALKELKTETTYLKILGSYKYGRIVK